MAGTGRAPGRQLPDGQMLAASSRSTSRRRAAPRRCGVATSKASYTRSATMQANTGRSRAWSLRGRRCTGCGPRRGATPGDFAGVLSTGAGGASQAGQTFLLVNGAPGRAGPTAADPQLRGGRNSPQCVNAVALSVDVPTSRNARSPCKSPLTTTRSPRGLAARLCRSMAGTRHGLIQAPNCRAMPASIPAVRGPGPSRSNSARLGAARPRPGRGRTESRGRRRSVSDNKTAGQRPFVQVSDPPRNCMTRRRSGVQIPYGPPSGPGPHGSQWYRSTAASTTAQARRHAQATTARPARLRTASRRPPWRPGCRDCGGESLTASRCVGDAAGGASGRVAMRERWRRPGPRPAGPRGRRRP